MSNLSILLIEDSKSDVMLVQEALLHRQDHHTLNVASTLTEGMKLLETHKYDVILLDLLLPDSNPTSILAPLISVMANHPGEYPTVVVFTAIADRDIELEALRMGAQGYFYKGRLEPDSEQLWVTLNNASVRGSYVRSLISMGFPKSGISMKVVTDSQRVLDNIIDNVQARDRLNG